MSFKFTKSNLNFDVYTVAIKPTTPGENNDIAIITSVPMPNWIMSPDKPSGRPRSDGDVWIQYSVSGDTFNALKNNSMMIATIKAWQYVDGAWAEVEAVSCQDGEWVAWIVYLYNNGTLSSPLTSAVTKTLSSTTIKFNSDNITYYDTNIDGDVGGFAFDNKIDVSKFKTLRVKCRVSFSTTATEKYKFGISRAKSTSTSNMVKIVYIPYSTDAVYVDCPISDYSGEYYLVFSCGGVGSSSQHVEIEEIILM